ncbi:hypothetical protein BC937DRAFT_92555 [Endogone sp. FLAS-F59071]|nr:hypothetical protein BC937DRAFT_92555 [Endogone sp. FLAS-F59071]|eukprot:RUS15354.1 hypothetical protein BC937DRAFT_92555 [Endogone sp. FLAS-F59071]
MIGEWLMECSLQEPKKRFFGTPRHHLWILRLKSTWSDDDPFFSLSRKQKKKNSNAVKSSASHHPGYAARPNKLSLPSPPHPMMDRVVFAQTINVTHVAPCPCGNASVVPLLPGGALWPLKRLFGKFSER